MTMEEVAPDRPMTFSCRTGVYAKIRLLRMIRSRELFALMCLSSRNWKCTMDLIYKHPDHKFHPPPSLRNQYVQECVKEVEQSLTLPLPPAWCYEETSRTFHESSSVLAKIRLLEKTPCRELWALLAVSNIVYLTIVGRLYKTVFERFTHLCAVYALTFRGPKQGSDAWKLQRCMFVTGSIFAQIIGWSDDGKNGAKKAFRSKCNIGGQFQGNSFTRWGNAFEDEAAGVYSARTGRKAITDIALIPHRSHEHDWLAASPDFITPCGRAGEIKCPPKRPFGESNGNTVMYMNVPKKYYPQCQLVMETCNLSLLDFVQYLPSIYGDPLKMTIDVVKRSRAFIREHLPTLKKFWEQVLEFERSGYIPEEYREKPEDKLETSWWDRQPRKRPCIVTDVNEYDDDDDGYESN